jgi:hypothetical protein
MQYGIATSTEEHKRDTYTTRLYAISPTDPLLHTQERPDLHRWSLHLSFTIIVSGVWVPSELFVRMFAGRR